CLSDSGPEIGAPSGEPGSGARQRCGGPGRTCSRRQTGSERRGHIARRPSGGSETINVSSRKDFKMVRVDGSGNSNSLIQARGLGKTYSRGGEQIHVLQALNLDVEQGEFVAFMGPSGSGKT